MYVLPEHAHVELIQLRDHLRLMAQLTACGSHASRHRSKMAIVIASPLRDDTRSLRRLMCKFDRYLAYSEEGIAECGEPNVDNTTIEVLIHPRSATAVFDLLERCVPWLAANGVKLVVDTAKARGATH